MGSLIPRPRQILAGLTLIAQAIRSANYVPGLSGWSIAANGSAEFNDVTVRGDVDVTGANGSQIQISNDGVFATMELLPPTWTVVPGVVNHPATINATRLDAPNVGFSEIFIASPYPNSVSQALLVLASASIDGTTTGSSIGLAASEVDVNGKMFVAGPLLVGGVTPGSMSQTIFAAGGTWTKPSGAAFVRVRAVGAGGGGGNAGATGAAQNSAGSGGGAGSYSESLFAAASVGASVTVSIGAGGASSSPGGNSTFGTLVTTNGGPAGNDGTATASGTTNSTGGGAVGTGQIASAGGASQVASVFAGGTATHVATVGGASILGAGGFGGRNFAGGAGSGFGSGGGGAGNNPSLAQKNGGAGANGVVIVETYF